ncbi:Pycsar system effector family protein [Echinicola sp. 20G]|uniref:Pycsar system effector family protein n=1 Tax=Echinicola sp. 20G TaxID=2781961 RepID=UPI00190FE4CD|nr:Pycsar system effector family protein [Echinicola sp. 20G]
MEPTKIQIIEKVSGYVKGHFQSNDTELFIYHNLEHTEDVVKAAAKIAESYSLTEEDHDALLVSAWFHDSGCWGRTELKDHENRSAKLAEDFLTQEGASINFISKVKSAIKSTKMPQNPNGLIEEILCDADLFHLGSEDYYDRSLKLWEEFIQMKVFDIDILSWLKSNLIFLGKHKYHTEYCKQNLMAGKQKNMADLVQKIEEMEADKPKKKKNKKNKGPERGIETLFRTTSRNHLELSSIADNKANIMISVNSIILTIIVSVLLRKLEEFPNYIIPTVMLLSTSLITMVFAILATRPNISSGKVTREAIDKKESNLLYFGNFHEMKLEEYQYGMKKMMEDADFLYGSMTKDIYYLGQVLGKKYKLLRKSYTVFMFGFIVSILAFVVASVFFPVDTF